MSPRSLIKKLGWAAAIFLLSVVALGHVFITDEGGYVVTWPAGAIPMQVKLATSPALSDGTSQSGSVVAAMQAWNTTLGTVQFSAQQLGPGAYEIGNDLNEIVMDSTIEGMSFGGSTLAVTVSFRSGNTRTESDIIFNTAWTWDSYRGSLREPEDIRRVAIHELGHALGLNHPNQAGQSVTAIMNSTVSNVDALQSDDIAGGQALYGAPGFVPGNDNFASATTIILTGTSAQVTGTNVAATAESGEPAHAGETARRSVWWKWTTTTAGRVAIATLGSNFDTVLSVHQGSTLSGLSEVVASDDVDPGVVRTSRVVFDVTAGTTYYIAVDGWDGGSGAVTLRLNLLSGPAMIVAWGYNDEGQANVPPGLGLVQAVAGGTRHSLALKMDGTVASWGQSYYEQPNVPAGLNGVIAITAGGNHSLALKADGTVVAWGDTFFGNPGNAIVVPAGLERVVEIAAGWGSSMALKSNGTVVSWGYSQGVEKPTNLSNVVAVAAGAFHNLALLGDGTVVGWGDNGDGETTPPPGLGNVIAIAAGGSASGGHSLALKQDGTVVAWGYNVHGQCNVPVGLNNVVAVAAGGHFSLALKGDGTIVAWGQNDQGQLVIPNLEIAYQGVDAGFGHGLALVEARPPVITSQPTSQIVTAGYAARFSVTASGVGPLTYQWRRNGAALTEGAGASGTTTATLQISNAQPENAGTYTLDITNAAGTVTSEGADLAVAEASAITVRPASALVQEGADISFTVTPSGGGPFTYQWRRLRALIPDVTGPTLNLSTVDYADRGYYEVLITNAAGGVSRSVFYLQVAIPNPSFVAWGEYPPPIPVITGSVADIEMGSAQFVVKGDGTVVGWGNNADGQAAVPAELSDVVAVSSGGSFTLALKTDGTVVGWGANWAGQITLPAELNQVVALAAGPAHSLALKADGTVVGWGHSDYGQHIIPVGLRDVVAIETGRFRSLALKSDGTMVEWGYLLSGASVYPGPAGSVAAIASGLNHAVALRQDGTVAAWGSDYANSTVVPAGLGGVTAIAAGDTHSLALKADGTVAGWGRNYEQQATPPAGLSQVLAIAASGWGSLAMKRSALPVFATAPIDQSSVVTGAVNFSVTVSTLGAISYQWQCLPAGSGTWLDVSNGGSYAGAMSATLQLTSITLAMNGDQFRCVATNVVGAVTSGSASLAVALPVPQVVSPPVSQTVAVGTSVTLAVTATSLYPLTYQWRKEGEDIPGAIASSYSIASVQPSDAADYDVVVTNSHGSATSQVAVLTVQGFVVTHNGGVTANADGSLVTLGVTVTGGGAFTYQWYSGQPGDTANPVLGATSNTLTIPQSTAPSSYWVRVSNGTQTVDSAAIPVGKWTLIDPVFGSSELSATAYGLGKHVVVGTVVGYSTDAINWNVGTIEAGAELLAVLFDGTRFVAGGARGQVFTSDDGINWQKRRAVDEGQFVDNTLTAAAHGNGITVFAGSRGKIMSSTDGSTWTWRAVGVSDEVIDLVSVAYGAGRFVGVGQNASNSQLRIYQSTNGVEWSPVTVSTAPLTNQYGIWGLSQVFYSGGRFIALGRLQSSGNPAYYLTSEDGLSWAAPALTNVPVGLNKMTHGAGQFLSADFRTSADGVNWSAAPTAPVRDLASLGYGNGIFVALGSKYNVGYATIATSADLTTWTQRVGLNITGSVRYGNGRFVGINQYRPAYSMDGLNWTESPDATIQAASVYFGNGVFVAVSFYPSSGVSYYTSTDGVVWTPQVATVAGSPVNLGMLIHGGDRWVSVGGGKVLSSTDLATWTQRYFDGDLAIAGLAYGGGRFVGVGYRGAVIVSTDGLTWTTPARPTSGHLLNLAYGAGTFVATDQAGGLWSSPDGLQWTTRQPPAKVGGSYTGSISSLTFGGGRFLASYGKDILSSSDGHAWQVSPGALHSLINESAFTGTLVYGAGNFWALGPFAWNGQYHSYAWLREPLGAGQPEIVSVSPDVTVASGGTATLTVTASGGGLSYQWYQGLTGNTAQPIAGATSATYTTAGLSQTGQFWVQVSSSGGVANSPTVTVAIGGGPVITQQPADADVLLGSTVNIAVLATGSPLPGYQWYRGISGDTSQPIASATAGSYSATTTEMGVGRYWVRVSNASGSVDSSTAVVTPWSEREDLGGLASFQLVDGRFVARAGDRLLMSSDGLGWSLHPLPIASLGKIAHGNSIYVMGGFAGAGFSGPASAEIYTSTDLLNWTVRAKPAGYQSGEVYETAYGNGRFVMGTGYRGGVFTSLDGLSWNRVSLGAAESEVTVRAIIFDNGAFVAAGSERDGNGLDHGVILASADGLTWTRRTTDIAPNNTASALVKLMRAGPKLFALGLNAGTILASSDGLAWQTLALGGSSSSLILQSAAWLDGRYVVGTNFNSYYVSTDGLNWTESVGPRSLSTYALIEDSGQLVAAGEGSIHTSVDTVQWISRAGTPSLGAGLNGVAFGHGHFLVSGFWGDDYISPDGVTWTATEAPFGQQGGGRISFGNGVFLSNDTSSNATVWRSTNGRSWQSVQIPGSTAGAGSPAFANGLHFVPLGAGQYATTPDGVSWTVRGLDTGESMQDITYGNGKYVMSLGRTTKTSVDLVFWVESAEQSIFVEAVEFGQGLFVAVGGANDGRILTSGDGLDWTTQHTESSNGIYDVVFDGERFAVSAIDKILLSRNGIVWRSAPLPNTSSITTGSGSFLGVGSAVWQSASEVVREPAITHQPVAQTVTGERTVAFSVGATGTALAYQWRESGQNLGNGGKISGATSATLRISGANASDVGSYDVVVSNSAGEVTSNLAALSTAVTGQTITFGVLADRAFSSDPIVLSAAASSGLTVTFTVLSGPATVSGNSLTLTGPGTVTVRASQAGDATYAAATPVDRSFVVTGNFSSWLSGKFSAGELADPGISGPNADPDGDGYSNLVEYALGLEPKAPSTTDLPEMSTTATDWVYTYTRPADRAELTYTVEVSADLSSWSTNGVTLEQVSSSGGVDTWRARYPLASAGSVFFRIKISQ